MILKHFDYSFVPPWQSELLSEVINSGAIYSVVSCRAVGTAM